MKKFLGFVITLASLGCIWAGITYPTVGRLMYETAIHTQSDSSGFEKATYEVDGLQMAVYQPQGSLPKPALILIHGFSANKDSWLSFAKHFSKDYQVYIPDLAGHGETGFKPEWDYSAPAQARLLLKLMNQLNIEQAHVVGHSMGGFIAATMAVNYPHRIQSVVLISPAGVASPSPSKMDTVMKQGKNPLLIQTREEFATLLGMSMGKPPYVPQPVRDYLADQYIQQREQLTHIFADFYKKDMLDSRLDELRSPVLVLWGGKDELVSVASLPVWVKGVRNAKSTVYEDLGHIPMVEDPPRVAKDVWEFLGKVGEKKN